MTTNIQFDMQRRIVSHMTTKSWNTIPHVSYLYEPDITDFYNAYENFNHISSKKISFNTIMLRTIVEGIKKAPSLNATLAYHPKKIQGILTLHENINISLPWLLPDGKMITPVIVHTEDKTLSSLSSSISEMKEKISHTNINELLYKAALQDTIAELKKMHVGILRRILAAQLGPQRIKGLSGKEKVKYYNSAEMHLSSKNLTSGTVTISNIGSIYKEQTGCFALLEIIPPQVFAVGLGAIQEKPGVYINDDGVKTIGIRKTLPMCLAFDHRAVDFSSLLPFLKTMDQIFQSPDIIHSW
ncbi:2-oxo acid dehydrogenase subunit E2 [Anaerocolumna sp. AGMB13020]|uniref:2-oxo acid dehydrogenase subunit E2 n=1 Tax=Anaerocolumna sp. AGMB13020 TaxID=3081750 RepID=UPI00295307A6|nr:2-oxo acid dehydrogenase subunit E2 [Anaerocolumna sp. AGMB13020]WOO38341.1 2-oxo acid dehydrogenase subunit E2 [Anaerocolumna sp. AGMB13020]